MYREGKYEEAYEVYSEALEIDHLNVFTNAKLFCNRALVGSKVCSFTHTSGPPKWSFFRLENSKRPYRTVVKLLTWIRDI